MFLENLLNNFNLAPEVINLVTLITSQLNLLLMLVQNVMDMGLIERGKYEEKESAFQIKTITDFISAMFRPHATLAMTNIDTQVVEPAAFDQVKTIV